jgi:hypothetical protein
LVYLVCLVYLVDSVCLVCLVYLIEPDQLDRPDDQTDLPSACARSPQPIYLSSCPII